MLRGGTSPNWSLGDGPSRKSGAATSCGPLSLSLPHSFYHLTLFLLLFPSCLSAAKIPDKTLGPRSQRHFPLDERLRFHPPRHMLATKTNEHVHPNAAETFFSFSSLAVCPPQFILGLFFQTFLIKVIYQKHLIANCRCFILSDSRGCWSRWFLLLGLRGYLSRACCVSFL